ncbi:Sulfatase [Halogranum amylolyticum]|uniref:Sulfatase n=1 Tax=Halogranum amylolyticum TaxID=660520 RepID=A0A1H8WMC2_9EURY|nr:sulfatase-like hydrolase/transferase [Halogranum amylolyticum]SEP28830.1 Sulfatase [Halogranum amylolyticum]
MKELSDLSVSNIYIYVADALRWDALPERVSEMGLTMKTISASIHTPSSFPSITTGLHPTQHGVWDFSYRLDSETTDLLNLRNHSTAFANSLDERFVDKPPREFVLDKVLNTSVSSMNYIEQIKPPFVFMERGRGGHSPYGNYPGNGWEYYREKGDSSASDYQADYNKGVSMDAAHFISQVEKLKKRDLLEDTLIIYTSDHGELLGENGCLGHNEPIHQKHVEVPTVFIHPSIEEGSSDGLMRHIDLFPTIGSLLQLELNKLPGKDLTTEPPANIGASFYRRSIKSKIPIDTKLDYESVWDSSGGFVFPKVGRDSRALVLGGKLLKASKREFMRANLPSVVKFYLKNTTKYANPSFDAKFAEQYLEEIHQLNKSRTEQSELDNNAKERLRELGYLE